MVSAGDVKIWDSRVSDADHQFYKFTDSYAWQNKANWYQVPYGVTNYNFIGYPIIENGNFWLVMHNTGKDSPFMYPNYAGTPGIVTELYTYWLDTSAKYNLYPKSVTILKNTANEVSFWTDRGSIKGDNQIQYKILKDSYYFEESPWNDKLYYMRVHSSPQWNAVSFNNNINSNDLVVDPRNVNLLVGQWARYYPASEHKNMMMQQMVIGSEYSQMYMVYDTYLDSNPMISVYKEKETQVNRLETMSATVKKGTSNSKVYIGLINTKNIFLNQELNTYKQVGQVYTSTLSSTINAWWRISGRVKGTDNSEYYFTQNHYGTSPFRFTMPITGTLESVTIYLYDRTSNTPTNIITPMDVYRQIKGQPSITPTPTPVVTTPVPTPTPTVSPIPTTSPTPIPTPPPYSDPLTDLITYLTQILQFLFAPQPS